MNLHLTSVCYKLLFFVLSGQKLFFNAYDLYFFSARTFKVRAVTEQSLRASLGLPPVALTFPSLPQQQAQSELKVNFVIFAASSSFFFFD